MAMESVKRAASSMTGSVQTRAAEPVQTEKSESISSTGSGYVEAVSTMTGGLQTGMMSGQNGEQMSEQEAGRRLKAAIQHANEQIRQTGKTRCEFSYHEKTNRISIKVMDAETKEVIREIPAEETLQMVEKMWELAGILVDEKR